MEVFCPGNFFPEQTLDTDQCALADHLMLLLDIIIRRQALDRPHGDAVPLVSEQLRRQIGYHEYGPTRKLAIQLGLIECDEKYSPIRHRAKRYRLGRQFSHAGCRIAQITNPSILKRLRGFENLRRADYRGLPPKNRKLSKCYEYLKACLEQTEIKLPVEIPLSKPAHFVSTELIKRKSFYFKPDQYGRVHTNITSLWKPLRKFLRFNDLPLVEIDIRNSQPLFLGMYLQRLTTKQKRTGCKHTKSSPHNNKHQQTTTNPSLCCADEEATFLQLVSSGQFYEFIQDRVDINWSRSTIKKRTFGVLYGREHETKVYSVLKREFPKVMATISNLKKAHGYQHLARMMQRQESTFVIGAVVPRLINEQKDIFLLTIHDSILTTSGNEELVVAAMNKEFLKLGVSPQLEVVRYEGKVPVQKQTAVV